MSEEKQPLIDKSLEIQNVPISKSAVQHEFTDDISDYDDEEDEEFTIT